MGIQSQGLAVGTKVEANNNQGDGIDSINLFDPTILPIKQEPGIVYDAEIRAKVKDRQKKDNHNKSKAFKT